MILSGFTTDCPSAGMKCVDGDGSEDLLAAPYFNASMAMV
jgi:hypothetical protein